MFERTGYEAALESHGFKQVEPEWLAQSQGHATWVHPDGVVAQVNRNPEQGALPARLFVDHGADTYSSHGFYSFEELNSWWAPVLRDRKAWAWFRKYGLEYQADITIALDRVGR